MGVLYRAADENVSLKLTQHWMIRAFFINTWSWCKHWLLWGRLALLNCVTVPNTACLEYLLCSLILLSKQTIFTNKKKELPFYGPLCPQRLPLGEMAGLTHASETPPLQIEKKGTRDEKWFAQGHLASKWWCLAWLSGPLIPRKLPSHWDKCSYTWGTWQFFRVIQWCWAIRSQSWALASQRKEHIS